RGLRMQSAFRQNLAFRRWTSIVRGSRNEKLMAGETLWGRQILLSRVVAVASASIALVLQGAPFASGSPEPPASRDCRTGMVSVRGVGGAHASRMARSMP